MAWSSYGRVGVVFASGLDTLEKGLEEIRRLEALMTTWRDDSEISKVNQAAGKQPVIVGPETFEVIEKSLSVAKRSESVFDISFEAMRDLWRLDENKVEEVPSQEAIEKGCALIDYRKIIVDKDNDKGNRSVFLEKQVWVSKRLESKIQMLRDSTDGV